MDLSLKAGNARNVNVILRAAPEPSPGSIAAMRVSEPAASWRRGTDPLERTASGQAAFIGH